MRINFKWRPLFTKLIIQVLLLGLILPLAVGLIVQRYESRSAYNQLIIEQGFKPYREIQIDCNEVYQSLLIDAGANVEDWRLMQKIFQQNKNNKSLFSIPSDQRDLLFMFLKDSLLLNGKIQKKEKELNICIAHFNMDSENLAILLGILPEYQERFQKFQKQDSALQESYKKRAKEVFSKMNVPFPDAIQDVDRLNEVLINPTPILGDIDKDPNDFFQNLETMLDAGILMHQAIADSKGEGYDAWQKFVLETNKFFIKRMQARL